MQGNPTTAGAGFVEAESTAGAGTGAGTGTGATVANEPPLPPSSSSPGKQTRLRRSS